MTKRAASAQPFPKAGDFCLIGHGCFSEPQHWWIGEVEWAAVEADSFLVRYRGKDPAGSGSPYLAARDALITFGTLEHCRDVCRAALEARAPLEDRFYKASRELTAASDAISDATIAAAKAAGAQWMGGRVS